MPEYEKPSSDISPETLFRKVSERFNNLYIPDVPEEIDSANIYQSQIDLMYYGQELTEDQEQILGKRVKAAFSPHASEECIEQGADAAYELTIRNLKLVNPLAEYYFGLVDHGQESSIELNDLRQEGNLGLMRAAVRYSHQYGRFSTYAWPWIKQSIQRYFFPNRQSIRIPYKKRNEYHRSPTISMETPIYDNATIADILVDMLTLLPEEVVIMQERHSDILKALKEAKHHRVILEMIYGLGDCEPMLLDDIANQLGKSRKAVQKNRDTALEWIRNSSTASALREYFDV